MTNENLLNNLISNDFVFSNLYGDLTISDGMIKCMYDGLYNNGNNNMDDFLDEISESDKDTILEYLEENELDDEYIVTDIEFEETIYYFYISN